MSMTSCPSCGLPRADELLAVAPCPLCGADGLTVVAEDLPPSAAPAPAAPPPTPPAIASSRFGLGLALGFALGAAFGVGGALGWQARPSPEPDAVAAAPTADEPPLPPAPKLPAPPSVAPPTVPTSKDKPNPFRPPAPVPLILDNSDGETVPVVRPGGHLVLGGKVRKLVVRELKGGAVLDASQLDAAEVEVTGPIDGGSRLVARAPGGAVTLRATVDGGSVVDVAGRAVSFDAPIGGANTRVTATLSSGGELKFVGVVGSARLEYRRANPTDPPIRLTAGRVTPPAVVVEVP